MSVLRQNREHRHTAGDLDRRAISCGRKAAAWCDIQSADPGGAPLHQCEPIDGGYRRQVGDLAVSLDSPPRGTAGARAVAGVGNHARTRVSRPTRRSSTRSCASVPPPTTSAARCAWAPTPDAALDPQLRCTGLENVRVADTSIMPTLVSGNTNAPAMVIGLRAAELIRQTRTGLAHAA